MRTSLLEDAGTVLRRIADLVPAVEVAVTRVAEAPPGIAHTREATELARLTCQLRSEAHGLASYAQAAAAVR